MSVTKEELFCTVQVPLEITEEMMRSLLCSAFEGGTNYWCGIDDYIYPEGKTKKDFIRQTKIRKYDEQNNLHSD